MEDMERQIENMEISERRMTINCGKGLPPLIAKTIFSKLVISDLPSCRLVSNTWNDLVLDYASSTQLQFLKNAFLLSTSDRGLNYKLCNPKMHCINLDTRQLSNDFDFDLESEFIKSASLQFDGDWTYTIIMAGSCNGLMLISKCSDYTWCQGIFNPMTNEFLQVSEHGTFDDFYLYGFGFSPITKQYKLFRVFDKGFRCRRTSSTVDTHYTMEVLTFGRSGTNHSIPIHNQWRRLHTLPFEIVADGVYLNGIIYWLVKEKGKDKEKKYVIYALDVETEHIEMTVVLQVPSNGYGKIHQFNGTIYATFHINWEKDSRTIQVWRMQEKDSWVRKFVICDISREWIHLQLIKMFEDEEILFMINMDFFCFYNPSSKKKRIISKNQKKKRYICQIESLNFGRLSQILEGTQI
uniref:Uncharacterized protein n=1 Tax=Cucumis sativus TaxID=3659 RepID=A0A0A0LWG1_CUCSA